MNLLSVENLTLRFGERLLFENFTFGLSLGDRVALVARNGTGKTSLMRVLMGQDQPDGGSIVWRQGTRVAYLPQEPELDDNATVWDALFSGPTPLLATVRRYEQALHIAQTDNSQAAQEALQNAMAQMDAQNAWDFEARIRQVLERLGVNFLDRQVKYLSGGQRKRVALAQTLFGEPDVLLLDEPTNHLDIPMVEWLEEYLTSPNLTVLMVTHDRYFLDSVCTRIMEMDGGQLFTYQGNYSYFLEKKEERRVQFSTETGRAQNKMRSELEWVRRMPKARGTKSKKRLEYFEELKQRASVRLQEREIELKMKMQRQGSKIVEFHKVVKNYGDHKILDRFSYTFKRGDRIGIVGSNGVGKSTFLRMLTGEEGCDGGKIVIGDTIVFGYYRQDGPGFKGDQRMIEYIQERSEAIEMSTGEVLSAAQFLEFFQFPRSQHYTPIGKLSGGEKRRLYLVTLLLANPNFLILDEPTNDLDLHTLQALEEFLDQFGGVLVVVSHDRFLLDRVTDHLFVFEGEGQVRDYNGRYADYWLEREMEAQKKAIEAENAPAIPKAEEPKRERQREKKGLSNFEEREFERLEKEIAELEAKRDKMAAQMSDPTTDYTKIQQIAAEVEQLSAQIDTKTERWLTLAEYV